MICISRRAAFSSRPRERREVAAVEDDLARGRLDQPEQRPPERRLAAARLADQAERLAAADLEVDAVDGLHVADRAPQEPLLDREVLLEPRARRAGRRRSVMRALAPATAGAGRRRGGPCSQSQHADCLVADLEQRRLLLDAALERVVAARGEAAALGPVERARHGAADHAQRLGLRHPEHRDRLEQRLGVRVLRRGEDLRDRPALDDPAART